MDNLGETIRNRRIKKNITIEELSNKTKISVAVLKDIEAGKFDRYKGDEAYVKMYLKKISNALEMDSDDVTQQYIELTKEIALEELQIQEEKQKTPKKSKSFSFETPELTRKPSVYEDKSHVTLIRGGIILVLVCLVVVVIWYGFYSTRSKTDNPSFVDQNQTQVDGVDPTKKPENSTTNNENTNNALVTFTRNDTLDFNFKLPEGTRTFKFKVEFANPSWASLKVNGQDYNEFEPRIYKDRSFEGEYETVELEFNVEEFETLSLKNGYSKGHHYYINDQQVPLIEEDSSEGITYFQLTLDKE